MDFFLNVGFVLRELAAEAAGDLVGLLLILDEFDMTEHDHALKAQEPFALVPDAPVRHAERSPGIFPERVDLVAHPAAVEIDLPVFLTVKMVERHPVRVAVVADHREHAAGRGPQDFEAFFIRHLLLETKHISEHVGSSAVFSETIITERNGLFKIPKSLPAAGRGGDFPFQKSGVVL